MRLFAASILLAFLSRPAEGGALRCGGFLITPGDTRLELKLRCGPPDHVEIRPVLKADGFEIPRVARLAPGGSGTVIVSGTPALRRVRYVREEVETWLYTGESGDLARILTLRRGRVQSIETLGRLDLVEDPGCARGLFDRGTRLGVVQLSCGRPDDRAVWEEEEELEVGGILRRRLVVHERWTYNPGRGRLLRLLEFKNGHLVRIETGSRAPR